MPENGRKYLAPSKYPGRLRKSRILRCRALHEVLPYHRSSPTQKTNKKVIAAWATRCYHLKQGKPTERSVDMFEVFYQAWWHEDVNRAEEWTEQFAKLPDAMRTALKWADDMNRGDIPAFEVSVWEIDDDGTLLSERPLFDVCNYDY